MDLKQTGRSLIRVSEANSSAAAGAVAVLVSGDYLRPQDIRLRHGCSRQATRAVGIVRALINTNKLQPAGPAEYETWFGIHAIVPASPPQLSAIVRDHPRPRGQYADPRRTPGSGGVGGFLLGLRMHAMSYDDILELVYNAPHDWEPLPPLTERILGRHFWLHADDEDDGDSDAARQRLRQVLTKLAGREAKAQGVALPQGGRRKKSLA